MTKLLAAARDSPLSRAQFSEIQTLYPHITFIPLFVKTTGDKDKTTSLRTLEKTDFFTKEIDEMVLQRKCDVGIHSAKDLPEPLAEGLQLFALTEGIDPSDSLVYRTEIFPGATIATSSPHREECVRQIFPDVKFVDVRGTIEERLALLDSGVVDGVVIAEAALIRLRLTHLLRMKLPGKTSPLQGRLAIVGRQEDNELIDAISVERIAVSTPAATPATTTHRSS